MTRAALVVVHGATPVTGLPRASFTSTAAAATSRLTRDDRRQAPQLRLGWTSRLPTFKPVTLLSRRHVECHVAANLLRSLDVGVFLGVLSTVGKIALICAMINILTRTEQLPANTSSVLSKVQRWSEELPALECIAGGV